MERAVEEVFECPVCLDRFKEPKILPCGHTVCLRPCLENLVQDTSVRCPECRACHNIPLDGVRGLPPNLAIVRFLDCSDQQKLNQQCKLTNRDENVVATVSAHAQFMGESIPYVVAGDTTRGPRTSERQAVEDSRVTEALRRYRNKGQVKKYFGTRGDEVGQMDYPHGICSTAADDIVVADSRNHRIQIFDVNGRVKGAFGSHEFRDVMDVCMTSRGRIVASDSHSNKIRIFDEHGRVVGGFGSIRVGSGDGDLNRPCGVATDDKGLIYVCDKGNRRVQVFSEDGKFVRKLGWGNLENPSFLSVTSNGTVVVSDSHCVVVFYSHWQFVGHRHLHRFGSEERKEPRYQDPRGVATDHHDNMIVSDWVNDRVQVFTSNGEFVTCFGGEGSDPGQLDRPGGVCLLSDGRIAVSDFGNHRVQIF